ncbi:MULTISPECIES: hypothetical protein [Amycolatopsis]|uniref:Uncharacterized protein n=1 Tax=Amycolatopsis thermalba TaxID=944492 RepID=A0ABY4P2K5_9PSEU|nr:MULTISPECIES: hypothetical protein [Amycolatopsis]OXM73544.1 hypothetical protein CF166_09525 [Amycolatopsis sp. KNN50.9b]UQS26492.1 hypothetical protein L1857_28620 [Amycolatopsis thermalba]
MSWNDFYRRRDILDAVLTAAARDPRGPLPFEEIPGAEQAFGTRENLMAALHYRWTQLLSGHLRAQTEGEDDHVDAVKRAFTAAVRRNRALYEVVATHRDSYPALKTAHRAEQAMLAVAAGLAEPDEPVEEVAKVGAAFEALLTEGPGLRPARPFNRLLRMLAPSA